MQTVEVLVELNVFTTRPKRHITELLLFAFYIIIAMRYGAVFFTISLSDVNV